jgi:hypothetical protein
MCAARLTDLELDDRERLAAGVRAFLIVLAT